MMLSLLIEVGGIGSPCGVDGTGGSGADPDEEDDAGENGE